MTLQQFLAFTENNDLTNNLVNNDNTIIDKITALKDSITELGKDVHTIVSEIGNVIYYLTHPKVLAWVIWGGLVKYSYIICITVCLLGIVFYLLGYKKGAKYSKAAFFGFFTIQLFNALIGGI